MPGHLALFQCLAEFDLPRIIQPTKIETGAKKLDWA